MAGRSSKLSFKCLADYRKKQGLNQNDFWKKFGVTQSGGSRYEAGRNIPSPVKLLLALSDLGILDNDTMEKAQKAIAKADQ